MSEYIPGTYFLPQVCTGCNFFPEVCTGMYQVHTPRKKYKIIWNPVQLYMNWSKSIYQYILFLKLEEKLGQKVYTSIYQYEIIYLYILVYTCIYQYIQNDQVQQRYILVYTLDDKNFYFFFTGAVILYRTHFGPMIQAYTMLSIQFYPFKCEK